MKKDAGFGALGVLALFTILAALLGTILPVIKSEAPLKASDWLGFAGNMIAAVLAGVAATVAWIAAQRQIRHAAMQNSVIAYGALKDVLKVIGDDMYASLGIQSAIMTIEGIAEKRYVVDGDTKLEIETNNFSLFKEQLKELTEANAKRDLRILTRGEAKSEGTLSTS